jgi:hypothetical protein
MGRSGGTGRDMEAICKALIASMLWRGRHSPAWAGLAARFPPPDGFLSELRSAHADRGLP